MAINGYNSAFNPVLGYSAPYNQYQTTAYPQQGYSGYSAPVSTVTPAASPKVMEWVEGEIGAKAYQMPNGWPANQPIPLWDSTDTVIYLKSWSPMGVPNTMQKLTYTLPEQQMTLPAGQSSMAAPQQDMSGYVTKDDFEQLKHDMMNLIKNQNANSMNQNKRGNQ